MLDIFPWQTKQWQLMMTYKEEQRFPHALLLVGNPGLGKRHFALTLANALLCNKINAPCGDCHACHLFRGASHPDLLLVEPEKTGQMIKIDQIREAVEFVSQTALQSGLRIIIIHPANAMNINAANALLKTLEEPAPNVLIILISDLNLRLPATIKSRCQKITFCKPTREVGLSWLSSQLPDNTLDTELLLNLAYGAPLKAKELATTDFLVLRQELYKNMGLLAKGKLDPLQLAAKLQDQDVQLILTLLLVWLQDALRFKSTQGTAELINLDCYETFATLEQTIAYQKIVNYYDHVRKAYSYLARSLNLNRQLMLEELFIRWIHYAAR